MRKRYTHTNPTEPLRIRNQFSYRDLINVAATSSQGSLRPILQLPEENDDIDDMNFQYNDDDNMDMVQYHEDEDDYNDVEDEDEDSEDEEEDSENEEENIYYRCSGIYWLPFSQIFASKRRASYWI